MSYLLTISLLLSLMYPHFLPTHFIISACFLYVLFFFIKNRLLMLKGLVYIHLFWIMFFIFFGINYFYYHNAEFFAEFLLFICLAGSMYIGIFSGINFRGNLLYIFVGWVFIIQFQLFTKNSIDQVLNERWTITTGWVNSNAIGALLVFSVPLLFLCFYVTKSKLLRIIILLEIFISGMILFLLSSRSSLLAVTAILLYMLLISRKKFRNILITIPLIIIFIFILFNIDILQQSAVLTFNRIFSSGLNGRDLLWSEAFGLIKENPLYGIGARNGNVMDFHNPILHIAVHYGLLTVVPFTALICSPLILIKIKQFKDIYTVFIFATYLAILVQSSIEAILTPLIMGSIGWYFIGLLYGFLVKNKYFHNLRIDDLTK